MGTWIAQHFFNPAFVLPGVALIASPILIHLINRLRFRRVRFAAMEFLLQSRQRNRRRLMFEQLLLLLLRILLVLLAVAIIGRLILDPANLSIFRGTRAHHVVLLDDSGSMQNRRADTTAFEQALDVVRALVAEGTRRPNSQRFTLLRLSRPDKPLFADRDVDEPFLNELETKLENLKCTAQSPDLSAGLDFAARLLNDERTGARHLHIITDFRQIDWLDQTAPSRSLRAMDESGIEVNIVRTAAERTENLGITELSTVDQTAAAGVPVRFRVGVRNFGTKVVRGVRVAVASDGQRLPLSIVFDEIEPEQEVFQTRDLTFQEPGRHTVSTALDSDPLDTDNERFVTLMIAESNPVLIIDGNHDGSEGSYLADALAADPGLTGIAPRVEQPGYLRTQPLGAFRSVFMLNVPELPPDAVEPLRDFVTNGGGLVWFAGDLVKPAFYNSVLYQGGHEGLFPVPLANARRDLLRDDATNPGPDIVLTDHPVFGILQGQDNPFIETVRVESWLPVASEVLDSEGRSTPWVVDDNQRRDGVATIATLRNRQPLAFEHQYGSTGGRIITFLTTAGPSWNNWAINHSYVVVLLELQQYVARIQSADAARIVGQPIRLDLPPSEFMETIEIVQPETAGGRVTRIKAAPENPDPATANASVGTVTDVVNLVATFRDTEAAGVYRIRLVDHDQIPQDRWLAYNVPAGEGELRLASAAEFHEKTEHAAGIHIQEPGLLNWIQGRDAGQELREILLFVFLGVLLLEQLLAWKLSYHPQSPLAAA